jgi:atypical dual specificity phosphatase
MASDSPGQPLHDAGLCLQGFGLAFGSRVILADCDLALAQTGIDVLMGPVKTGKSSLLRSLAGQFDGHTVHRSWGHAWLRGRALQPGHRPQLVAQHVRSPARTVFEVLREAQPADGHRSGVQWRVWAQECLERYQAVDLAGSLDQPLMELPSSQQRRVRVLALAAAGPEMLLVDEPTFGLDARESASLLDWLRHVGTGLKLLVTLHNQQQARLLADSMVLLGGGRVLAHQPTERFFDHPANEWVEQFLRSGSLDLSSPDARAEDLDADAVPPAPLPPAALAAVAASREEAAQQQPEPTPEARASQAAMPAAMAPPVVTERAMVNPPAEPVRRLAALPPTLPAGVELASMVGQAVLSGGQGPRRFRWIVPGVLAGCPQPGVVAPIEYDLDLLGAVGVTHLITLTERDLPQDLLRIHGLANTHLPIFDREAPSTGQMQMLLVRMQRLLQAGEVLAVHCLAGLGRTGLVLAAWLVRDGGLSAATAIERLRRIDPAYVQTEVQEAFLQQFEDDLMRRLL